MWAGRWPKVAPFYYDVTALNDSSKWGYTLGNAVRVWRTGVGIDRRGNVDR